VSTIAKENEIVFIAPTAKTVQLTSPANLHPYIFRLGSNTDIDGRTGASIIARWKDVKRVATIAPDYAYGRDAVAAFVDYLKKARPDIEIVDQQWPKLGQSDFTAFINAQLAKQPEAVFCDVYGGDFVTFAKQAARSAILRRSITVWSTVVRSDQPTRRWHWGPITPTAYGRMPTIR